MHYLAKRINELPEEQKLSVIEEIISSTDVKIDNTINEIAIELLGEHTEKAEELHKSWGKMQGLSTGYAKIDNLTKGLVDGELIVIAGKTSYGKTTLSINIANQVALNDTPVLFVTLEMTKAEVASRYMFINGGNTDDYAKVASLTAVQRNDELNWKSIDKLIERFVQQFSRGLIVIDHLHYFSRELDNVAEDLGRVTKELKKNAVRHNLPIILVSHVRKTGKTESASIDDLRGSSYIAQDADIVLMVGRNKDDSSIMKVMIEKNRNRGYDYNNNVVDLRLDQIKVLNDSLSIPGGW